ELRDTQFRPPAILPAFPSTIHLLLWIAGLIAILVSPLLTNIMVRPQTRYLVMSKRAGPTNWYADQIFKSKDPLDILFLGSSRIFSAIDHAALQRAMAPSTPHLA